MGLLSSMSVIFLGSDREDYEPQVGKSGIGSNKYFCCRDQSTRLLPSLCSPHCCPKQSHKSQPCHHLIYCSVAISAWGELPDDSADGSFSSTTPFMKRVLLSKMTSMIGSFVCLKNVSPDKSLVLTRDTVCPDRRQTGRYTHTKYIMY